MYIQSLLFDLDGTLLDTAPDLAYALNLLLKKHGRTPLPFPMIRPVASDGAKGLLSLGFGINEKDPQYDVLRDEFIATYANNIANQTRLFEGMEAVLQLLEQQNITWGIVTNKPAKLTHALLEKINLYHRAACIVSGDTLLTRKPDPEPLLHACKLLNHEPARCIYIGDAKRDIEAGQRAGMLTILARYGYINSDENTDGWNANITIERPQEIIKWLQGEMS
jgi:phosphoglycolate phosphatase